MKIKKAMTVQSLLDMTSGLDWLEKAYTPDETIMRMYASPDRTEFVLSQPMSTSPGTKFYYNSGNPYVLSALITKKTRSEEHTSELQSPDHLVCRLLLEKKKQRRPIARHLT